MTARYRSREKMRVTLTLMPSAMTAVIAGSPARVAGILISTLGRSTILCSSRAWSMVAWVWWASRGSTSMDTRPSMCPVGWKMPAEQVAGVPDVIGGDLADGVVHGGAAGGQFVELLLVGRAVLECGLEDRRVRGHPDDVLVVDQVFRLPECRR